MGGALGDSHRVGEVPQAHAWVVGDTDKDVAVICQEVPVGRFPRRCPLITFSWHNFPTYYF